MISTVKLTINVPAPLRRKANAVAALRGENVSDVLRTALAEYVQEAIDDARDIRELDAQTADLRAGKAPLYEHAEVWAEIDELEAQGALPA